ncbi:MAG: sugar ABC transporter ATP-binding protein [Treponema sp.]|nr:sugar ABC transporter ATP-binding protein [Treponema sp.]
MISDNLLELKDVTKVFPGVRALNKINFDLKAGEIHALVGENGAGKSTLINIISGMFKPDEGEIFIDGKKRMFPNARAAFVAGIGVVHQERNLIPTFTVAENLYFDSLSKKAISVVSRAKMLEEAGKAMEIVELNLDPDSSITFLSAAQQQMLEIARTLTVNSKILLLDEPTSSISSTEVELLIKIIRKLRNQGVGIIYISHKLEEVFELADRITVFRDGCKVGGSVAPKDLSREALIERMVGRKEAVDPFPVRDNFVKTVMEADSIRGKMNTNTNSFTLRKGEILGWYGLVGSGRTELARMLIGVDPIVQGSLKVNGEPVRIKNTKNAFGKYGIYYMSENRKSEGLFLQHSIAENISIVSLNKILKKGLISKAREAENTLKYIEELNIKTPGPDQSVGNLSGGNQQKTCIARGLFVDPEIIIIDEPTVGIDVITKGEIHRLIYDLAEKGKSIILVSSDLAEIVRLADRILVFRAGGICAEMKNRKNYAEVSNEVMNCIIADSVGR